MDADVLNVLTEAGPLGIFALYLIWQRQKDAQRWDSTAESLTARSDKEETLIRERFQAVIDKYDKERESLFRDIVSKLDQLLNRPSAPVPPSPSQSSTGGATETMIERAVSKALKDKE